MTKKFRKLSKILAEKAPEFWKKLSTTGNLYEVITAVIESVEDDSLVTNIDNPLLYGDVVQATRIIASAF